MNIKGIGVNIVVLERVKNFMILFLVNKHYV